MASSIEIVIVKSTFGIKSFLSIFDRKIIPDSGSKYKC